MSLQWMRDLDASVGAPAAPATACSVWQSVDGSLTRAYASGPTAPAPGWVQLLPLQALAGASAAEPVACHYVVETDVAAEHDADFNAWYAQEHLPGLAAVPGTVHAARWRRCSGSPVYLACYDLADPATLQRPQWLAVRHSDWSARVRPRFLNSRRTMFVRAAPCPPRAAAPR